MDLQLIIFVNSSYGKTIIRKREGWMDEHRVKGGISVKKDLISAKVDFEKI